MNLRLISSEAFWQIKDDSHYKELHSTSHGEGKSQVLAPWEYGRKIKNAFTFGWNSRPISVFYGHIQMNSPRQKNIVGIRLAKARKAGNLTQLDLSRKVSASGVSIDRAGIAKIEVGLRCVYDYELVAIAKVLAVDPWWLLTGRKGR